MECKTEHLNGGEGRRGRMPAHRLKPSAREMKQSTNGTLYCFIYFKKCWSVGFQPSLDRQVHSWLWKLGFLGVCMLMRVCCIFEWRDVSEFEVCTDMKLTLTGHVPKTRTNPVWQIRRAWIFVYFCNESLCSSLWLCPRSISETGAVFI